jgi:hypothetical protein
MKNEGLLNINVASLQNKVTTNELLGLVDSTSNLKNDKVYIFSGSRDNVIRKSDKLYELSFIKLLKLILN